jgi:hypothetical protein
VRGCRIWEATGIPACQTRGAGTNMRMGGRSSQLFNQGKKREQMDIQPVMAQLPRLLGSLGWWHARAEFETRALKRCMKHTKLQKKKKRK